MRRDGNRASRKAKIIEACGVSGTVALGHDELRIRKDKVHLELAALLRRPLVRPQNPFNIRFGLLNRALPNLVCCRLQEWGQRMAKSTELFQE